MSVTVKELIRHLRETCDLDMEVVVSGESLDLSSIRQIPTSKVDLSEDLREAIKEQCEEDLPSECPVCGEEL